MTSLKSMFTGMATLVAAAALIGGCSTSASFTPISSGDKEDSAQLAAYAATAKYPADAQPKADTKLATLIRGDVIRIVNFSDQPVHDANVWVNGAFVRKVDSIPPLGTVTLKKSDFYDGSGRTLAGANVTATRVAVQQGDTFWATLGPVMEP